MRTEENEVLALAKYIKLQYPTLIYRFDLSADIRLTIGQATKNKRIQMEDKGYPDLFIAKPNGLYNGLYIEIKKDRNEIYTKKGKLRNSKHINNQNIMLERLSLQGYKAVFGCGFEECIGIIDAYLGK